MNCKHAHGDFVLGIWVCGQCWRKLDERPKSYVMVENSWDNADPWDSEAAVQRFRQELVQAEIRVAEDGDTLSSFIGAIARRLMAVCGWAKSDAYDYALDVARIAEEEFGSADFDWSTDGAWDLLREDMSYWDEDVALSNV